MVASSVEWTKMSFALDKSLTIHYTTFLQGKGVRTMFELHFVSVVVGYVIGFFLCHSIQVIMFENDNE